MVLRMDGGGGLSTAIGLAIVCMLLGSVAVLGAIGWAVTRKKNGVAGAALGVALGALVGIGAVYFTFYTEDYPGAHAPGTRLDFEVPEGFSHDWVVLIENPEAPDAIVWSEDPPVGRVRVPRSGVARLQSLARVQREYPEGVVLGRWSGHAEGRDEREPIAELGGSVWMYRFRASNALTEPDLGSMSDAQLTTRIRELESR